MPGRLTSPPCLLTKPRLHLRPHPCPAFSCCFTPIQVLPECTTSISHMHPSDGFRLCCQGAQLDPSTQHESLRLMSLLSFSRSQNSPPSHPAFPMIWYCSGVLVFLLLILQCRGWQNFSHTCWLISGLRLSRPHAGEAAPGHL